MAVHHLSTRQTCDDPNDPDCNGYGWYYSETVYIVRWAIFGTVVLLLLIFLVGGYIHAQRRMKRGLPPLRYHAWLVSRQQRARFFPAQHAPPVFYHNGPYGYEQGTPLNTYGGAAPPAYGEHDYVPPYQPPQGSSKVNPDQNYQNVYNGASSSLHPPPPVQPNRAAGPGR